MIFMELLFIKWHSNPIGKGLHNDVQIGNDSIDVIWNDVTILINGLWKEWKYNLPIVINGSNKSYLTMFIMFI